MKIDVVETSLPGVLVIQPDAHADLRGRNATLYAEELYRAQGITVGFVEDKISVSRKDVLRGIHGDADTWKLITCLSGAIHLVVVDCDEVSPRFGRWEAFSLSGENLTQVLVPPKYGNGHLVMSGEAVFHYKWSHAYDLGKQFSYRYDDPRFKIGWPVEHPILSDRDAARR